MSSRGAVAWTPASGSRSARPISRMPAAVTRPRRFSMPASRATGRASSSTATMEGWSLSTMTYCQRAPTSTSRKQSSSTLSRRPRRARSRRAKLALAAGSTGAVTRHHQLSSARGPMRFARAMGWAAGPSFQSCSPAGADGCRSIRPPLRCAHRRAHTPPTVGIRGWDTRRSPGMPCAAYVLSPRSRSGKVGKGTATRAWHGFLRS